MRAALAFALLAAPAAAHGPVLTHEPDIAQVYRLIDAPPPGEGRIRLVYHGDTGAMLTQDQFWSYQKAYKRALTRHAFHHPIHTASRRARADAWHAVVRETRSARGPIVIFPVPQ